MGSTSIAVLVSFMAIIAIVFFAINVLARRIAEAKTKSIDFGES